MFGRRERRRKRLRERPVPDAWRELLDRGVPIVRNLLPADRAELEGGIQVFLAEKRFEGAGGFAIDDEVRVVVAAHASLLLLHRPDAEYSKLLSVIVYPGEFLAHIEEQDEAGLIWEDEETRAGESWSLGSLVLSWSDVLEDREDPNGELNVILHEFAHQLDAENGEMDGLPPLADGELREAWPVVMHKAFEDLRRRAGAGRATALDPYAAEHPSEFFAVATEVFFQQPRRLLAAYPEVYRLLTRYYLQDPVAWRTGGLVERKRRSHDP
ncbi:MAG: M90 family metallopeptidase [Candidatus Bipolaricaulota bacterium]